MKKEETIQLDHPLLSLVARCQTICEAECCGVDAYDFSPVHIASFLLMYEGKLNQEYVNKIRAQLISLKANYGSTGASRIGITIPEMNQIFGGEQLDKFVEKILANLDIAIQICNDSRYQDK